MQSVQVVTLKSGQQNASSVDAKSPMYSSIDYRCADNSFELAFTTYDHRASAQEGVCANHVSETGVVHGEFQLGRRISQERLGSKLPAALDKPVPMVATADIGCLAAELLQEKWKGHRVVELEGLSPVTPKEIAATFARLLGRPVRVEAVPRETWGPLFKSQGMKNPEPRVQMLDGFNEGWIKFEGKDGGVRKGKVELETVLRSLIEIDSGTKARSTTT